ncbi:RidA family protein [soil metagenome]
MKFHATVSTLETIAAVHKMSIGTAVEFGELVLLSGFVYMDPMSGTIPADTTFEESARGALSLVQGVLSDLGLTLDHVVKVSSYLASGEDFPSWNAVFNDVFTIPRPLRTTIVAGLLGSAIEIEIIASRTTRAEASV